MRRFLKAQYLIPAAVCLTTLMLFRVVLFIGVVPSRSMEPTIQKGSIIVGSRIAYWFDEPQAGDIIIFKHENRTLVKRVAAIGENRFVGNPRFDTVPVGHVYVVGDNTEGSFDSRIWEYPFIPYSDIIAQYLC